MVPGKFEVVQSMSLLEKRTFPLDNSMKIILFECVSDCLGCDRIRKNVVDKMGGLHSIIKSSTGDLTMLWRPPILSTTFFLILSHPKQSETHSNKMIFMLLSRGNVLFSRRLIDWTASNLPGTTKTGQWRIGRGSCGQMRPK